MRITSLLTTTILIGIGYAAMSADEITKCLSDIATQFSDADTKAQKIDLTSFVGLQTVRNYPESSRTSTSKFGN